MKIEEKLSLYRDALLFVTKGMGPFSLAEARRARLNARYDIVIQTRVTDTGETVYDFVAVPKDEEGAR